MPFVAAFYQCLNSCVGLVLKGNPTSPSSLEELLHNSIRNVEIAGGKAVVVLALQRVVGGFMSAAEEWRSLRAACSAPLAEEAGAQRGAARKALEALSEEVTQLQARADQISNAREAKSLAKETAENAVLNAQTMMVRAQKIIVEQWVKDYLLEEEVAKLLQEQNQVELAVAEKKAATVGDKAALAERIKESERMLARSRWRP
ncbi:uncharacterized protein A4U43_UnF1740 [Asparagus officinalis]|uniref:Uncharacterized protein n=1 Tax=Asparagus officinalis TaxID=4686 RepID=A0A1R3L7G3_ASPOF|nr:uncharacterized protein A4U43_UnF1740 [Asparagus officinalis]